MRILIYGDYYQKTSGYARQIKDLIYPWINEGHQVAQVGLGYHGIPVRNDIQVYPTKIPGVKDHWAGSVLQYAIEDFNPDIVFTLQDFFVLGKIAFELAHPGKFKHVHYGLSDGEGLSFYAREPVKWVHQLVHMTNFTKTQVANATGINDGPVIYAPVDLNRFYPMDKQSIKQQFGLEKMKVVTFVARPQERKLVPNLLLAFKELLTMRQDCVLVMVSAGHNLLNENDSPVGTLVEQFIAEFGLENHVIIPKSDTGRPIDDAALNIQYNLADINVLCSSGEGFGMPFIEAAACKTPSVAVDNSASGEIGREVGEVIKAKGEIYTYDGIRQTLYDHKELARKLNDLLSDGNRRERLGQKAYEFAQELSHDKVAARLLKVFETAITDDKKRYIEKS